MILADLIVTAVVAVGFSAWWSAHKLLSQDEMFSYQTDTVRTFAEVVHIQRHFPISLDPLVYHAFAHLSVRLFGASAFAMRVPSMLGYAGMLCCVYLLCYRAARARWSQPAARAVARFAAVLPMLSATYYYSVEGRPYGLLLGFSGLALVCWQAATRDARSRRWSLPLLALAIALAVNTHYFAMLLLPPLYLAEAVRMWQRRRLDAPMLSALLLGTAGIVGTLPFQPAVRAFSAHYYSAGVISLHAITQAYRSLLVDYTSTGLGTQRLLALAFVVAALLLAAGLMFRWPQLALPAGEATLLLGISALPLFGFLLARFYTHSYEVRYVLETICGLAVLLALVSAPWLVSARAGGRAGLRWLPYVVFVLVPATSALRIRAEEHRTAVLLASLDVPPAMQAALAAEPGHNLYVQQMGNFELAQFYQPDAVVRSHTVLVYDAAREVQFGGHDTEALTAEHMQHFTALPIVRYNTLRLDASPQVWLLGKDGWDFAHSALPADGAAISAISPYFGGTAAIVQFPAQR